ncbi:cation:proton antiporter, partial [Bacteroides sp. OttesenSCG-928-J23]|nr:cation:proton antiporter [Bacteroides sp. OttesenSCG-928-J23]
VLVGNKIEIAPGVPLLNDDVLNGTVIMILFTCIIASIATERAARKIATEDDFENEVEEPREEENILIPLANPETIDNLVNMALLMKEPKRKNGLTTLSVMNDNNASEARMANGKRCLNRSAMVAAAADVEVHTVTRFDMNVASGIIHTMKECNASEVILGLHRKITLVDSFLGTLTENLLTGTHKQVMIAKCLIPVNTLRRIVVAVPPKAEYEAGFFKWVERLCRMGVQLGCRIHFFANKKTLRYLEGYINRKHKGVRREFSELAEWEDLLLLTGQVNYDHLLVIVSARRGFISYDPSFEKLPMQITKYFSNNSLMVLYPDQFGDPQEALSFSEPLHHSESHHYDSLGKWFYRWFKKN